MLCDFLALNQFNKHSFFFPLFFVYFDFYYPYDAREFRMGRNAELSGGDKARSYPEIPTWSCFKESSQR